MTNWLESLRYFLAVQRRKRQRRKRLTMINQLPPTFPSTDRRIRAEDAARYQ